MSEELKKARARGAQIETLAKKVEVSGLEGLVQQLQSMLAQQQEMQLKQTAMMAAAIDRMVDAINEKEVRNETDLSELVTAVTKLKPEPITPVIPYDYQLVFERDQRGLMKEGSVKLVATQKRLN